MMRAATKSMSNEAKEAQLIHKRAFMLGTVYLVKELVLPARQAQMGIKMRREECCTACHAGK